jgi:P4 family phage/plasmid primase-like protien
MGNPQKCSEMVNALVATDGDVDLLAKNFEANFRRITGGDTITAKILYRNTFSFKPHCKLILAANELPVIKDKTRGFYRRMLVIMFNKSFFGVEDRNLDKKLTTELPGILNWALIGRKRLYKNKEFNLTDDLKGTIESIRRENNPIEMFIDEKIGFLNGVSTYKKEVYAEYTRYCKENNNHPMAHARFSREFYSILKNVTSPNARESRGDQLHYWPNIYVKNHHSEPEPQAEQRLKGEKERLQVEWDR